MLAKSCFRALAALLICATGIAVSAAAEPAKPNVIFALADDMGRCDVGCYGQKKIRTPNIDRLATEGMLFTQAYCGTSVCAPSRYALMTGKHMGHAAIRANREIQPEGQMPMPAGTFTVAQLFKKAGYQTACIGKWGLGLFGTTGDPLANGFDHFFGYNCQRHAHNYFPSYLYRDAERFELDGKTYAQDLIAADVLSWVRQNKDKPFFLFFACTLPHGHFETPDVAPYADRDWPQGAKTYATMVSRFDSDLGRLLELLKELKLDSNTLVVFASDNGATETTPTQNNTEFFESAGALRGTKRTMYEGGLRVPAIVRWPGHVPAGKVSDVPWAFYDFLPTCADLLGTRAPEGWRVDGISMLPTFLGGPAPKREYLYWELHEPCSQQAVRFGDWKAVKPSPKSPLELYDLTTDVSEKHDLASAKPELAARAKALMKAAHEDSPLWPPKERPKPTVKAPTSQSAS